MAKIQEKKENLETVQLMLPPPLIRLIKKKCEQSCVPISLYLRQIIIKYDKILKYLPSGKYAPKEYDPQKIIDCYYEIFEIINQ